MRMHASSFLRKVLGPLLPVAGFCCAALVFLFFARIGFITWNWQRVAAVDGLWSVLGFGLRMDVLLLCMLMAVPTLMALLLPGQGRLRNAGNYIIQAWLLGCAGLIIFMEAATPSFVGEYDVRPNRLFFEYLNHPFEVFFTLWGAYKPALILGTMLTLVMVYGSWRFSGYLIRNSLPWGGKRRLAVLPLIVLLLFCGARSSFGHRPANLSTTAFCNDPLINQLGVSSTYSLGYAIYRLRDESDSVRLYGKMPSDEVFRRVRESMLLPGDTLDEQDLPTLHRQIPLRKRDRPLNLVIILQESLGAKYVESLGGLPLTPELEKLAGKGLWFSRLYATGTRSVRGIEAVVTGFPPTPSRSVVKLGQSQQNFFTLGRLLKAQGYATEFIYGGDSQFDNMRGFLLGNGFDRVIDEDDFKTHTFRGTWGVCDEDIFNRTHEELLSHGGKPFFTFVFSVSNHSPFEYPDGRIAPYEEPKNTRNNTVKYVDYALGRFFEQAQKAPYWENTLFLVVADHEDRVTGDELVPVRYFHIPGLILGADVKPGRYDKVASQIDLAPTLLSMMGIESVHPMQGHDLLQTPGLYPGRAVMQFDNNQAYMVGDRVVIHSPGKSASFYRYVDKGLVAAQEFPELGQEALAQAFWPAIAYRENRYRLP